MSDTTIGILVLAIAFALIGISFMKGLQ